MSKAKTPLKVLRVALKRLEKGWTKGSWVNHQGNVVYVCLEGAIYGYCNENDHQATEAQLGAIRVVKEIIFERYAHRMPHIVGAAWQISIPNFNDARETIEEEVIEVVKLAIIRLETEELEKQLVEDVEELLSDEEPAA